MDEPDTLEAAFAQSRPQVVINCVGLVKQLSSVNDPLESIPINAAAAQIGEIVRVSVRKTVTYQYRLRFFW